MHIYYVAGVPYSDDLYHSGVKGQKWGIRRYQNEDGTLTALGKIHYGAQKAGQAIKSVAKKAYDKQVERYKASHPNRMTDSELRDHINRIKMENEYNQLMRENRKPVTNGRRIANEILESSAKSLAKGLVDRMNSAWESNASYERRVEQDEQDYKRKVEREKLDYKRKVKQDNKDYERKRERTRAEEAEKERKEHDRESKTMSYKFDRYVEKSLPKNFSKYKDSDWEKFEKYAGIKEKIRGFEGSGSKSGGGSPTMTTSSKRSKRTRGGK